MNDIICGGCYNYGVFTKYCMQCMDRIYISVLIFLIIIGVLICYKKMRSKK